MWQGEFGLTHYREHIQGLTTGDRYQVTVSYQNQSGALTVESMSQLREESVVREDGRGDSSRLGLVLALLAVIIVAVLIILRNRAKSNTATGGATQRTLENQESSDDKSAQADNAPKYCTACGSPRQPRARYCSSCGKEL